MIALSTTESEYLAGTEAMKEAIWLMQKFLMSIGSDYDTLYPVKFFGDNQDKFCIGAQS